MRQKIDPSLKINSYYSQKISALEYDLKVKLSKLESDLEENRINEIEKLTNKINRKIKQAKIDRDRKLKNITRLEKGKEPLKVKKKPINHMSKADYYFSRVVRSIWATRWEDWQRYNFDPTSNTTALIKDLTCGHYKTRWIYTTRYLLTNCIPQTHGQNKREHLDPRQKIIFRNVLLGRDGLQSIKQLDLLESQWTKNENQKVNMQEMHEYRKQQYQLYKHMRE